MEPESVFDEEFFSGGVEQLVLTEAERERLAGFDRSMQMLQVQIVAAQLERIACLREFARAHGFMTTTLEDLRSACGEPFIEDPTSKQYKIYRRATARKKPSAAAGKFPMSAVEEAYFCVSMYSLSDAGCGWVKGVPAGRLFDNIGPLSGSAGTRYFCKVCNQQIGELATRHS